MRLARILAVAVTGAALLLGGFAYGYYTAPLTTVIYDAGGDGCPPPGATAL